MRQSMAEYVRSIHDAYTAQARTQPPAVRGQMALIGGEITVIAAGAANLHVVATRETLPPPVGQEVEVAETIEGGPSWILRFYDPVVLPSLGVIDESEAPRPDLVRRVLGVSTHLYHLIVQPGAELTAHHGGHAGAGLANSHVARSRDYESMRSAARGREALVDEMEGADVAGLLHAQALLAGAIVPGSEEVSRLVADPSKDREATRRAVLAAVRATDD